MQHDDRVIVVGAGPVGAVTALALVKKGIPVTLLEGEAGAARGSARRHHPPADRRDAGRARAQGRSLCRRRQRRHCCRRSSISATASPASSSPCSTSTCSRARCPTRSWCNGSSTSWCGRRSRISKASGIAEVRFSTKVTGLAQGADHVDVTVINDGGEAETTPRPLRHRRRRRTQHRAAPGGNRVRGLHLARALHQDRHQLRFRRDRPGLLHPQLFLRPQRMAQPVQGQRQRPARNLARHHAGAARGDPTSRP